MVGPCRLRPRAPLANPPSRRGPARRTRTVTRPTPTTSPSPELPESVDIFDTMLRDGSQQEGLSLTVDDKLRVAEQLDHLGVTFIEGAGPARIPRTSSSSPGQEGAGAR